MELHLPFPIHRLGVMLNYTQGQLSPFHDIDNLFNRRETYSFASFYVCKSLSLALTEKTQIAGV